MIEKIKIMSEYLLYCLIASLCLLLTSATASAQSKIGGVVVDQNGEPLIGVTVRVNGTSFATITDIDGQYSVQAQKGQVLKFSYLGFATIEQVAEGSQMNIIMIDDSKTLDELVVVGYGVQKKSDLTGSISSISAKDLEKSSAPNISQALQGKAAGVYVTSSSGSPGAGATIRIRGYGSVSSDMTPLYIVDGQPVAESRINHLSPQDISSIEILKDASASAIYGSRGTNGVVLITTKQGEQGKTSINFSASFGVTDAVNKVKMMDSHQLYNFIKEGYDNDGMRMPRNYTRLYKLDGVGLGPIDEDGNPTDINVYNTNWWDESTRTGIRQNYNLSISGGSEKMKSYFSVGHYSETGILLNTDYKRINIRTNNEYKFNKYITIGQTLGIVYAENHDINMPISEILLPDPFSPVIAPNADKKDPNYEYNKYMGSQYSYYGNPVGILNRQKKEHINKNIDGTAYMNINLGLKGLNIKTLLGFDVPTYNYYSFTPYYNWLNNDTNYNLSQNQEKKYSQLNTITNSENWSLNYSFQNILTYNNTFGKHSIDLMAGYNWESSESRWSSGSRQGAPSNDPAFQTIDSGILNDIAGGSRSEQYLISQLGRINYGYDNKYLMTVNIRHDGSSKFARGNRWGTFPSFSFGWKIDNEKFFKSWNQQVISMAKFRAGWGQNGNQNISNASYYSTVATNPLWQYAFNGGENALQAYGINAVGNPDISWETSEQINIGLDLSYLNNALTLSADYYVKQTKDMLMNVPLPDMAGYENHPWSNAGSLENKGFEFLVGYKGNAGDFTYSANVNLTFQKNKLLSIGGTTDYLSGSVSRSVIGQPFGQFYGYVYDGIFQSNEEVLAHVGTDGTTVLQPNAKAGDMRFRNVNNDNKLNDEDRTFIGNPNPSLIYGGNINLGYKGFDLSVYFQGVTGNDLWVNTKRLYRRTSETNLLEKAYTNAWRQEGDKTDIPRISRTDDNNDNYRASSWYVESGAFCKVKNIQLGYTLPKNVMNHIKFIESINIYCNVENAFTFTNFEFTDPEVTNGHPNSLGIEDLRYPNSRKFMIGLNVQF